MAVHAEGWASENGRYITMELISPGLHEDYCRWRDKIGEDPYAGQKTVGILDVLRAHYLIVDFFASEYGEGIGGIGPKDLNLLHSTLTRQASAYSSTVKWNNDFEIVATLFWGLIKNHAFHDVNKRTATLTLLYHLIKINKYPTAKQRDFERLALRVASNKLDEYSSFSKYKGKLDAEILFISDFLRKNSRWLDKQEYIITYKQLDGILRKYNYGLANPNKNQIEVVRFAKERTGLINRKTISTEKRIGSINFPGWTRQIGKNKIKEIRNMTNLTVENGYDSDAFFHDADPLPSLISEFQGLLIQLADK